MKVETLDSKHLKAEVIRLGFSRCGLAPAEPVDAAYMARYEEWLRRGCQGDMHYLENHLALRRDPCLLLPGARTVISLAMSYNPGPSATQPALAWYAQGRDYHDVIRERLLQLVSTLHTPLSTLHSPPSTPHFRICVDTAPIMEKYWAWRCGLGWIGRHTQLVIPGEGSAFFLAEVLTTQEADHYDEPQTHPGPPQPSLKGKDLSWPPLKGEEIPLPLREGWGGSWGGSLCGRCRRCLDACPTHAITEEGMDARRCLSYLTIEHRGPLPGGITPYLRECFYGCDRCLRACPHLSLGKPTPIDDFRPSARLLSMQPADWSRLSREDYQVLFRGSAVKRAKYEGLCRNIRMHDNSCSASLRKRQADCLTLNS